MVISSHLEAASMRIDQHRPDCKESTPSGGAAGFHQSGFATLPAFVDPIELDTLRSCVDETASTAPDPIMARPGNHLFPLRWNHPIVALLLRKPERIQRLREILTATDLKWLSAYVSTKAPQTPPLWWHQDWWCWDHPISFRREPPQVAVLCYLTDTSPDNGALRVLPGSHARTLPIHALLPEAHGHDANGLSTDHPAMCDHPEQVTLPVRAGDIIVTDYRLLHGTHANRSASRRDCILMSFMPAWRALPKDILTHLASHPALPAENEAKARFACGYSELLPRHSGVMVSLPINRIPPANFPADRPAGAGARRFHAASAGRSPAARH